MQKTPPLQRTIGGPPGEGAPRSFGTSPITFDIDGFVKLPLREKYRVYTSAIEFLKFAVGNTISVKDYTVTSVCVRRWPKPLMYLRHLNS
jgi:hypothetical protein